MKIAFVLLIGLSYNFEIPAESDYIFYGNYITADNHVVNLLPPTRNQNQPKACDASWAFATTTTMSTLFNLQKKGAFPEVVLSPQMLINCSPKDVDFSCEYNKSKIQIESVLKHLTDVGVTDESCNNYYASDEKNCSDLNICKDCHNGEDIHKKPVCTPVPHRIYKLKSYAPIVSDKTIPDEKFKDLKIKILNALKQGPLVCNFNHSENLFTKRDSVATVYTETEAATLDYNSWVSLVGHVVVNSDKGKDTAWIVQHSFGDNVGLYGVAFLNSQDGINSYGILDNCFSLTVQPEPTQAPQTYRSFVGSILTDKGVKRINRPTKNHLNQGLKLSLTSKKFNEGLMITGDETPINWQNFEGVNFLTYVKNQHIPTYCGSCWAQAGASVLADRLNIDRKKSGRPFPKVNVSVQAIINCKEGGSCFGGDSTMLFQKAEQWKVPLESCQTYQAVNPSDFECHTERVCSNQSRDKAYSFEKYTGVKVTEWGRARGSAAIKAALKDGPIVCDFQVTDEFVQYSKIPGDKLNIWTKQLDFIAINHAVSVVGWGKQDDTEYWIVRNSWGREWGYDGFFYIKAGENLLGIESECSWAKVKAETFDK